MHTRARLRTAIGIALGALVAACGAAGPTPVPSTVGTGTVSSSPSLAPQESHAASARPTPVDDGPVAFPLAVVTGVTNLKATISLDELATLATGGTLTVPC